MLLQSCISRDEPVAPVRGREDVCAVGNGVRFPFGQKIRTVDGELSVPGVASPGAAGYDFLGKQLRIGWRGGRMDWARILAFVTGMVDQELLARIEYLAAENRILKAQLKGG